MSANIVTKRLNVGDVLTVTANATSSGSVVRMDDAGAIYSPVSVAVSTSHSFGPFHTPRIYQVISDAGLLVPTVGPLSTSTGITPVIVPGAMNTVSSTAECGVSNYFTALANSTGGDFVPTLADGTFVGQLREFEMTVRTSNDHVLTPATAFADSGTTITFSAVGQSALLMWNGAAWQVIKLWNVLTGVTAPVLA